MPHHQVREELATYESLPLKLKDTSMRLHFLTRRVKTGRPSIYNKSVTFHCVMVVVVVVVIRLPLVLLLLLTGGRIPG